MSIKGLGPAEIGPCSLWIWVKEAGDQLLEGHFSQSTGCVITCKCHTNGQSGVSMYFYRTVKLPRMTMAYADLGIQ